MRNSPRGFRTPVSGVRGQRPRPLDYGTIEKRILAEITNNFQENNIKAGNRQEKRECVNTELKESEK